MFIFVPNPTTNSTSASKAEDITAREWLIIDIDNAFRAKNESINPDVHAEFKQKYLPLLEEIIDFNSLVCKLWNSGNGYHITIKCKLGVDDETEKAVKNFYKTLSQVKLGGGWEIDPSMANRAQLTKFYGTWTHKGNGLRQSHMENEYRLYDGEIIDLNKLKEITEKMTENLKIQKNKQFVEELLENYMPNNNLAWSANYVKMENCPLSDEHTTSWSATIYLDGNEPRFHCFGEHCQDDKGEQLHTFADFYKKITGAEWKTTPKKTKGKTLSEIETESEFVGYATGIKALDDALGGGLRKKTYSVLTGNPGEGKSTLCVQIINNLLAQGYKVGYYQSDLSLPMTKANLILQSGMSEEEYMEKYEYKLGLFGVNEFGYESISTCGDFDVFFIDNMASLLPNKSDYDFQKELAKKVKETAEKSENHIVWVCHQRKHNDFDSMDKIEGTSDISRFAYTVVDVVKCNKDYWNKVKNVHGRFCDEIVEFTKSAEEGTPILAKINLFKNQQTGQSDSIPMCFSPENKTFTPYDVAS
ncbi:MAG: ATPase domain-containing protein [Bacteroidales bacterium]|nr:ATPase domain-containing protein [Bacteroidales bacterium]